MEKKLYELICDSSKSLTEFVEDAYEIIRVSDKVGLHFNDHIKYQGIYWISFNTIEINLDKINETLIKSGVIIPAMYRDVFDPNLYTFQDIFVKLHILQILLHENEHAKQQLILKGVMTSGIDFYDQIIKDLIKAYNNFIYNYLYKLKRNTEEPFFERNANIASYSKCLEIAKISGIEKLIDHYRNSVQDSQSIGYFIKDKFDTVQNVTTDGSVKQTYKMAHKDKLYDKLIIPSDLPLEKKIELGLELSTEELLLFLSKLEESKPGNNFARYRSMLINN